MSGALQVADMAFKAGAAITQWRLVKFSAAETVSTTSAASDNTLGVCQEEVSSADATNERLVNVRVLGVSMVKVGTGGITRGAPVRADTSGQVVALAGTAGVNEVVVGIAMETASSGDLAHILLTPGARSNTAVS